MDRRLVCLCAVALLGAPAAARAQECRAQDPAEQQAIARALATVRSVVEAPIVAGDWQVSQLRSGEKAPIAIHPNPPRPLMTCTPLYSVMFILKLDTPRGKAFYAKQKAAIDGALDEKAILALAHDADLGQFSVALGENMPYLREEIHDPMARLTIPGAALAYRVTPPPKNPGADPPVYTDLFFGDWAAFPWDKNAYLRFPFAHPPGSPNIETLRVRISGLPEVVDPILKQIDWSKMSQALTR